jgi:hypothetical protein
MSVPKPPQCIPFLSSPVRSSRPGPRPPPRVLLLIIIIIVVVIICCGTTHAPCSEYVRYVVLYLTLAVASGVLAVLGAPAVLATAANWARAIVLMLAVTDSFKNLRVNGIHAAAAVAFGALDWYASGGRSTLVVSPMGQTGVRWLRSAKAAAQAMPVG